MTSSQGEPIPYLFPNSDKASIVSAVNGIVELLNSKGVNRPNQTTETQEIKIYTWALCQNNTQLSLWSTVNEISKQDGVCNLSNDSLKYLAMCSRVSLINARNYLIEAGLLNGELKPLAQGTSDNKVWHLVVPDDIESKSKEWCKNNFDGTIKSLINIKARQRKKKKKAGYVYLIKADAPTHSYKIGASSHPEKRIKNMFNIQMPFSIETICIVPCSDMMQAESALHNLFARVKKDSSEWFDLSTSDVNYIKSITQYMSGKFIFKGETSD